MVGNVEELLQALKDVDASGKFAAAFGSFGWSGEGITHIENYLNDSIHCVTKNLILNRGIDSPAFPLRIKFSNEAGLNTAQEAGKIFGEQVLTH